MPVPSSLPPAPKEKDAATVWERWFQILHAAFIRLVDLDSAQTMENKTITNLKDNTRAYARAVSSSGQSIAHGTRTVVAWNSTILDSRSAISGSGTTSWRFTAPEAGTYLVSASVGFPTSGAGGGYVWMYLHKNGSASAYSLLDFEEGPSGTSFEKLSGADMIQLAAGDYIDIRVNQNQFAGSAARAMDTNAEANWVNIVRLVTDL